MNLADLPAGRVEIAVVRHDVVCDRHLASEWKLRSDPRVGLRDRVSIPRDQAKPLQRFVGANDDQRRKRLVGARLHQQRSFVDHVGRRMLLIRLESLRPGGADEWVQDRVQGFPGSFVVEDQVADLLSIESPFCIQDALAKLFHDSLQAFRTGLDDFARQLVSIDDGNVEVTEHLCDGRLSACDPTCEAHDRFHGPPVLNIERFGQDDLACATHARMRAVVQRVKSASVSVEGEIVGAIREGLLVYLGAARNDEPRDVQYTADKIAGLRIFPNDDGRMSLSVEDIAGAVLVVSQFTLFGDVRRGRRPSFDEAAAPEIAEALYLDVVEELRARGIPVETGTFRAMMLVRSEVDGPVTIQIDSRKLY